jgi:2-polyprenyl-3-methyl-5-hydroxy-6-metoxy-1,4-benzoquinol methylase
VRSFAADIASGGHGPVLPPHYHSLGVSKFEKPDGWLKRLILRARTNHALGRRDLALAGDLLLRWFPEFGMPSLRLVPLDASTRILDVGCGIGSTLYGLYVAGFTEVLGIDPFIDRDVCLPNGKPVVRKQAIEDVRGTFDLVMFHHSFEHVPNPRETLSAAASLLSAGGTCLVRVPLCDSFAWTQYREHWVQIDAPRHWVLHTVASLRMLGESVGLTLKKVVHDSNAFQFWGSEQCAAGIPLHGPRSYAVSPAASMFSPADIATFEARARRLNAEHAGDQGAFYFEKQP